MQSNHTHERFDLQYLINGHLFSSGSKLLVRKEVKLNVVLVQPAGRLPRFMQQSGLDRLAYVSMPEFDSTHSIRSMHHHHTGSTF